MWHRSSSSSGGLPSFCSECHRSTTYCVAQSKFCAGSCVSIYKWWRANATSLTVWHGPSASIFTFGRAKHRARPKGSTVLWSSLTEFPLLTTQALATTNTSLCTAETKPRWPAAVCQHRSVCSMMHTLDQTRQCVRDPCLQKPEKLRNPTERTQANWSMRQERRAPWYQTWAFKGLRVHKIPGPLGNS